MEGWQVFWILREKITSWACLLGSGLKLIFQNLRKRPCVLHVIRIWWPIWNWRVVKNRLNMIVVHTEVIWKRQQCGNNFIAVFPLSPPLSKMFFNSSANNPVTSIEIKVTFNEMPFEQSVLHLPLIMSVHQEAAKWISLDWSSQRVIKWGSFDKTDLFYWKK